MKWTRCHVIKDKRELSRARGELQSMDCDEDNHTDQVCGPDQENTLTATASNT